MKKIFADTGYWIALLNPDDNLHQKARDITTSIGNMTIITSEMIFTELLNAFSGKGKIYKQKAVKFIEYSFTNPQIEVISQTEELFKKSLELYKKRLDKQWSLTDCSSFYIMEKQNIVSALAYDKHFQQAGFIALLR